MTTELPGGFKLNREQQEALEQARLGGGRLPQADLVADVGMLLSATVVLQMQAMAFVTALRGVKGPPGFEENLEKLEASVHRVSERLAPFGVTEENGWRDLNRFVNERGLL